ncbi:unnamed protein product [Clonostachys rosea f. rosea IK726]|uniref:NAD(P)-binding domain-containing protein n=2 Tax=Bionectria ochroleuca TaxID=29856 RepID=A0A0B7K357_BIOOC|nr:unnamed protein product [Clonostachys rosea f. rosea IK726]
MHLILTGATGLVGSGVLDTMVKMNEITKISILSRRPVKFAEDLKDPRINVVINKDFENYDPAVLSQLKDATGCVWALGISQTQVDKEEYVKITKTMALKAAEAFQSLPPKNEPFNFVYVSGAGATTSPGRFSAIFARIKGETELALAEQRKTNPAFHASSIRPAFVDAAAHQAIKPYLPVPTLSIRALQGGLGPIIRNAMPGQWSPTEQLGRFLTEVAMGKHKDALVAGPGVQMVGQFPIVENSVIRKLAGLS